MIVILVIPQDGSNKALRLRTICSVATALPSTGLHGGNPQENGDKFA
ncbi:hypothetical protein LJR290_006289 [Variovorax sp. LjRoot290]